MQQRFSSNTMIILTCALKMDDQKENDINPCSRTEDSTSKMRRLRYLLTIQGSWQVTHNQQTSWQKVWVPCLDLLEQHTASPAVAYIQWPTYFIKWALPIIDSGNGTKKNKNKKSSILPSQSSFSWCIFCQWIWFICKWVTRLLQFVHRGLFSYGPFDG